MKPIPEPRLKELLSRCAGKRVLVVGDVHLNEYVWGKMTGISTEGPVPVVQIDARTFAPGSAGNTAAGLAALGAEAALCGCIGNDPNGRTLRACLDERNVDTSDLITLTASPTNTYTKVSAGGYHSSLQEVVRMQTPQPGWADTPTERAIIAAIERRASQIDALILVDQFSSVVTRGVVEHVIELRRRRPLIVVGDSRDNVRDMRGMDVIVPNDYEAGRAVSFSLDNDATVERAGEMLLGCQKLENVVITRGKLGMSVFSRGGGPVHLHTCAQEVFDVTGAGDTVAVATMLALLAGGTIVEAAQFANLAAGVAVSKVGTVTVSPEEILAAHARYTGVAASSKIKALSELAQVLDAAKSAGSRIAWTNGCFDILHSGHISYLRKARQVADLLVVGVNSDATVARLKGPSRPVNRQDARAEVLAEMACVDYVIIFDEDSPAALIEALKPDVYVKGGDYTIDTINQAERRIVEGYGGQIQLLGHVEGMSTTAIIERIVKQNQSF